MVDGAPADAADGLPIDLGDQPAAVLAQKAVRLELTADAARVAEAPPVGVATHVAIDYLALQELEVACRDRPQGYRCLRCVHSCRVEGTQCLDVGAPGGLRSADAGGGQRRGGSCPRATRTSLAE